MPSSCSVVYLEYFELMALASYKKNFVMRLSSYLAVPLLLGKADEGVDFVRRQRN
jgi:hypothetical protein